MLLLLVKKKMIQYGLTIFQNQKFTEENQDKASYGLWGWPRRSCFLEQAVESGPLDVDDVVDEEVNPDDNCTGESDEHNPPLVLEAKGFYSDHNQYWCLSYSHSSSSEQAKVF